MIVADNKMIVRGEVGALLLLPLLTSSLPNNVRIGEYTPKSKVFVSLPLKGQCHNFCHESSSPKPLNITLGSFRKTWQIIGTISDSLHLKVNLKEKTYLCVNSTTQRCTIKKTSDLKIFSIFHRWCTQS
jgi:hypothetical protein